jgi:sugar lactone lactonase YvrE
MSANGYSQPDSIVQWRDSVIVGFQNHVAKDGSDGKSSTIVEFSLSGQVKRVFSVPGHNDGLRVVGEDHLWALQNEDANPNLVVIDLKTGNMKKFTFAPTVHGGGYDDIVVRDDDVFITASNPNLDPQGVNIFPALVRARLSGSMVTVEPVLNGNANATDIPTGTTVQLNLTDPDSMTIDPRGNIVLDSQADGELVFIRRPFSDDQQVGRILITKSTGGATTLDDTAFAPRGKTFLLFSDVAGDTIYRLDSPPFGFEPGVAYSASDTDGFVGTLNLDKGVVTTIVTGLGSARGMVFVRPNDDDRGDEGR